MGEGCEVRRNVVAGNARGSALGPLGNVGMADHRLMGRDGSCWLVLAEHVIDVGQELDGRMCHGSDDGSALGEAIEVVAFTTVERFDNNRDAVCLGEWRVLL